jgi:hypothetical protein
MLESHLRGGPEVGIQFLKRAVDLLEWGRNIWKNVSNEDRGTIFQDTFLRSVRGMHLKMFMDVRCKSYFFKGWSNRMTGVQH